MSTSSGEPTSALYGLSVLLLKLLRELRPSGVAFARDSPRPTFRHAHYAEYKAGRAEMPDTLRPQWTRLDQLIAASGGASHVAPGFEADDVIATLAKRLAAEGSDVTIVSGDRDLFQLVGPSARVLFVGARGQKPETIDEAAVVARYGVSPADLPFSFGLIGEVADNLVGVPGVGVKTAAKLVKAHRTPENLARNIASVRPEGLRESLRGALDRVAMNTRLARLRDDVPLEGACVHAIDEAGLDRLKGLFTSLEFRSLLPRLDALRSANAASPMRQ